MAVDPIAERYAKAAFESAKSENAVDETQEQLHLIKQLLEESADLRSLLLNPSIEPSDKVRVVDSALKSTWSSLVRSVFHVVVSMGRAEALSAIIDAYDEAVDVDRRRIKVMVRSAYRLSDQQLDLVKSSLERREKKQVLLETELSPELLGGMQLVIGNKLIDGSVKRQLADLKEKLQTTKVY